MSERVIKVSPGNCQNPSVVDMEVSLFVAVGCCLQIVTVCHSKTPGKFLQYV